MSGRTFLHEQQTVRSGYDELVRRVRDEGDRVSPRGLPVREVRHATLVVHSPEVDAMPVGLDRGVNVAVGAVEALNLLGGVSTPRLLERVAPAFARFMDGEVLAGAYGPRIRWQLPAIADRLVEDPDSRQAVLAIYDPAYDTYGRARDVPCTLSLQFFVRHGALELAASMRSNDVWLGWAYDAFQFTQLQVALADSLGLSVGAYVHHAASLHLYERDLEAVDRLRPRPHDELRPAVLHAGAPVETHQRIARDLLVGGRAEGRAAWYSDVLEPYLSDDEGDDA